MANAVLKTDEEQAAQGAHVTPLPVLSIPVEATEASTAARTAFPASSSRRYDQATTERALALAAELQHKHDSELTTEQVIGIGEEAHLRPEFILQALAQVEEEASHNAENDTTSAVGQKIARKQIAARSTRASATASTRRRRPQTQVTDRAKLMAAAVTASCTLMAVLLLSGILGFHLSAAFLLFGLGPWLAILCGASSPNRRIGMINGSILGLGLFVAIVSAASPYAPELSGAIGPLLVIVSASAVLGATGAAVRQRVFGSSSRARKRLAALLNHYSQALDA